MTPGRSGVRLYSPEWVAAFNEAVADLPASEETAFRMLQVVHGAPEGTIRIALDVDGPRVALVLDAPEEPEPDVTVVLSYEDAAALAAGTLDPASALAEGRVRVRGDLAVLVAGQAILGAASARLGGLSQRTTR